MIHYSLATETDDAELRALLRDNSMPSWVNISMEREPSFFAGKNKITRDFAIIARDGKKAVGMYINSLQPLFINGQTATIGYLGGLRTTSSHRGRIKAVRDGYASISELTPSGDFPFWFTSIASENTPARRLLEAALSGMPRYAPCNEMITLALPTSRGKQFNLWRNATEADIPAMINFYNQQAAQFQFAPTLSKAWIHHIGLDHFLIHGDKTIEACVAIWNQAAFKQVVVRGYRPLIHALRPFYNLYATLTQRIRLPATDSAMSQSFLAFAAFSESTLVGALELVCDLLSRCTTEAAVIGLHDQHPLLKILKVLKPLEYRTRLYTVTYANDKPPIDGRIAQPEVALL